MEHYNGRIIAIDASMAIYQFLVRDDVDVCRAYAHLSHTRKQAFTQRVCLPTLMPACSFYSLPRTHRSPSGGAGTGRPPPCSPTRPGR